MNVVIDCGNSAAKVGIFDQRQLILQNSFREKTEAKKFLQNYSPEYVIISTVNQDAKEIAGWITSGSTIFNLTPNLPLPVRIEYASKDTLGVDRIAAVCGARDLFPGQNCLVIDAGTCVTYEFLDDRGAYHGGAISPGMRMRFRAMHTFTARLPQVEPIDEPLLTGDSTITCMQTGVILGLGDEMDGMIARYKEKYSQLQVILCGGDCAFFENKLKASIFASPELVLRGLNSILLHNADL